MQVLRKVPRSTAVTQITTKVVQRDLPIIASSIKNTEIIRISRKDDIEVSNRTAIPIGKVCESHITETSQRAWRDKASKKKKHVLVSNSNASFYTWFSFMAQSLFVSSATSRENEKDRMLKRLSKYGYIELEVSHDGNCMMRAISHQLFGTQDKYSEVRNKITGWLQGNEEFDVDGNGTQISHFMDTDEFPNWSAYCTKISRDGIWGDHLALVAAAQVFAKRIWILSSITTQEDVEPVTVIEPFGIQFDQTLCLSHWHENHYNSLKPFNTDTEAPRRLSLEGENIQ
jgi:hypothetical protein